MKISVVIATYNGERYIKEQLESILEQTITIDEVVICDDASKDYTVQIVKSFIIQHQLQNCWKVEINQKNLGYASNFVHAVMKTTGDIIFFCDQDDVWLPNRAQVMLNLMQQNSEILMLGSEYVPFTCTNDAPSIPSWERKRFKRDNSLEHLEFKSKNIFIGCQGCSMCIRRSFFDRILPYWYEGWAHDEFVWKLALCLGGAFIYHGVTLMRRLHSNNISLHKMRDVDQRVQFLQELKTSHETMLHFALDTSMDEKSIRLIQKNIESVNLRIGLLKEKQYYNSLKLFGFYSECYHSKRSMSVELYMAIKG